MSDIQEEQKRLYKRAEENDLLRKYNNLKTALDESQEVVISYKEEINELQNRIDKSIEYIEQIIDFVAEDKREIERDKYILKLLKEDNK